MKAGAASACVQPVMILPVWEDNEERMYSYRQTPLLLCTFFLPRLSWLWRWCAFVNTVVQSLCTIILQCIHGWSGMQPRTSFLSFFFYFGHDLSFNWLWYHNVEPFSMFPCTQREIVVEMNSQHLNVAWQNAKSEWSFVGDRSGLSQCLAPTGPTSHKNNNITLSYASLNSSS